MSFLEVEAALGVDALVRVFASDLSESGLAKARAGQYSSDDSVGLSQERLARFFVPVERGVQVIKRLREMCVFARHDITRDPPFAQLDLVLCSNLLIYMDAVLQRRVLQNIHYALKPGGHLVLGPAETTTGLEGLFSPLDRKLKIFLRKHAPSHLHVGLQPSPGNLGRLPKPGAVPAIPLQWSTAELQRAAERVFFAEFPAASVIVNSDHEVLHFQGHTSPYLEAPTGGPTAQLLRLAHPDLRLVLGRMLRSAKKGQTPVRRHGIKIKVGRSDKRVSVSVLPVLLDDADRQHYLVVFDRAGSRRSSDTTDAVDPVPGSAHASRLQELEADLAANQEYFQAIIDQQDATHTELQAAYEASLSVNEEYQSTNEELESTKEEMQSLNEELSTVNEQLQLRHAELRARSAEVLTLLESTDMPMLLLTQDLRLRAFNSRASFDLQLTEALVGHGIPEGRLPLALSELRDLTDRALAENAVQEKELQDQRMQWRALRVWPVQQSEGEARTLAVALVDIMKLKSDVAEAAAARAYSEAIVDTVMEPLVVLDNDLRILYANPAFCRVFQVDAGSIRGKRMAEIGAGEWSVSEVDDFLRQARQARGSFRGPEVTLQSERIGSRTFQLSAAAIVQPHSGTRGFLLAMEDLSVRKLAEASAMQASRMQAVGELAGGVAHEINNQMTVVLGYVEFLLKHMDIADPRSADIGRIAKAARRSADITGQLLAFSRRRWLNPVVLDLNTLVAASETLLHRALGPDVELEIHLGEDVGRVRADQAALEHVLVNLALNARDAMQGKGQLFIETTTVDVIDPIPGGAGTATVPRGLYARLTVRDTGAGMDKSTQARVFEPFFTTKQLGAGTGLGLASVYGTVKQSGGLIWVESEPGRGTTFTIDLPQLLAAPPVKPRAVEEVPVGGTETILVVEDEEDVRAWLSRDLRELGYTVLEAASGSEAVQFLGEHEGSIGLALIDVVMPGFDGVSLRTQLAETQPELPVILMSGFAQEELIRRGRLDAETAFIHKPFDVVALAFDIRRILDARGTTT